MEHRELDDEELRKIKVKRNVVGGIEDATEGDGEETEESEIVFDLPEEDGDLVGLTPSQLKREMERREKAQEEARLTCARLIEDGNNERIGGNWEAAEPFYMQALLYDPDKVEAQKGRLFWRTENF